MQLALHEGYGRAHGLRHVVGQAGADVPPGHAARVGWHDVAARRGGHVVQEVAHQLCRRSEVAPARREGPLLALALQAHALQGVAAGQVRGEDVCQQGRVGVGAVPARETHAVGDHAARLACRGNHVAAGAHAEGEGPAPVWQVAGQLVWRRAQGGVSRVGAVLGPVHVRLQVLYAGAHGEGFALQRHPAAGQQLKDVPRGVAAGQHHVLGGDGLLYEHARGRVGVRQGDGPHAAARGVHVRQALPQADLPAKVLDLAQQVGDNGGEHVAAHVRLGVPQDLPLRPRLHELLQNKPVVGALGARGKLAVREGPRATQAELDVALWVQPARPVEALDRGGASRGVLAALHQERRQARLRQGEGAEEAGAPRSHHHGARGEGGAKEAWKLALLGAHRAHVLIRVVAAQARQELPLRLLAAHELDPHGVEQADALLLAGVDGPAARFQRGDLVPPQAQAVADGAPERGFLLRAGRSSPVERN